MTTPFCIFHRADNQLRAIVYKLVSGLYESESQRIHAFYEQHKTASHSNGAVDTSTASPQIDLRNKDSEDGRTAGSSTKRQTHNNNDVTITATTTSVHSRILNNSSSNIGGERIDDDVEFYSVDNLIR